MGSQSADAWAQQLTARSASLSQNLAKLGAFDVFELVDPAAAAANDLAAAAASVAAPSTVSSFLAGGVAKLKAFPRSVVLTTAGSTPADVPATATITGTGPNGKPQVETVNLSQSAGAVETAKAFRTITKVEYPAGDGTGGTVAIGTGNRFAFPWLPKLRGGAINVIREIVDGATVTNGTFQTPANSAPFGTYTPNTAANGAHDYALVVERA